MSSASQPGQGQQGPPAYPVQPPFQPAPPKRGRSRLLMGCGIIAGLLVLCVGAIAVFSLRNGSKGSSPSPTAVARSTAASTAAGAAPATSPAGGTANAASAKPVATVQAHKKGEAATAEGQKVTLNEVTRNGGVVVADVTVENTGTKQANVSSLISFNARDALGNQGSFKLSESKGMDGTIEPGGKLRGSLGFEFAADARGLKLYYSPAAFTGQPIVFALDDAATAQPFPPHPIAADAKPFNASTTYKAGEVIRIGDLIMQLEKVSSQGTLITADFVAYNAGGKVASLSSLLSFTGQDATGKKGDFKLPDKASFDGTLLPGDSLRGQVRLEFDAGSTGHTLTYRPALFGGQGVKWALD